MKVEIDLTLPDRVCLFHPAQRAQRNLKGRLENARAVDRLDEEPHGARAKRPFTEGLLLPVFQLLGRQALIVQHRGLVHVHLLPLCAGPEPVVFQHFKEERRAGIRRGHMEERDVQRQVLANLIVS